MLILRRKIDESLIIGDNIHITIVAADAGGNVTLGIDAPKDVLILRSELKQAATENMSAAINSATPELVKSLNSAMFLKPAQPPKQSGDK